MVKINIRMVLGFIVLLVSFVLLVWLEKPIRPKTRMINFQPGELKVNIQTGKDQDTHSDNHDLAYEFPEERSVTLEWTPFIRLGDSSIVNLRFHENQSIQKIINSLDLNDYTINKAASKSIYDFYSIFAEARLEFPDVEVFPQGTSGRVLSEGDNIIFTWVIKPTSAGKIEGIAWFYLVLFPFSGSESIQQAISAQQMEISVKSIFGVRSNYWRIISFLGLVMGFFLLLAFFRELMSEIFIRREKKMKNFKKMSNSEEKLL